MQDKVSEIQSVTSAKKTSSSMSSAQNTALARPLQLVAVLMGLSGMLNILRGIPFLFVFGLGLIYIIIGGITIKLAVEISKLQKKGYIGGVIVLGLNALGVILPGRTFGINVFQPIAFIVSVAPLVLLYYYRKQFVN